MTKSPTEARVPSGPKKTSVAFGLWMLVVGLAAMIGCAQDGNWSLFLGPAPIVALGTLLLIEGLLVRTHPRPQSLAERVTKRIRLPVWLHLMLQIPFIVINFFGGGVMGAFSFNLIASTYGLFGAAPGNNPMPIPATLGVLVLCAACFFTGAYQGLRQTERLWNRYVPAHCPNCPGNAYCRPGRPYTFACASCGHIQQTALHKTRRGM